MKCVTWSLQGLDHSISLPPNFLIFNLGFHILGAQVGSTSFVESFVAKALHEGFKMIFSFFMLADLHVVFAMFLLCYT
jgi:hypothetical protein